MRFKKAIDKVLTYFSSTEKIRILLLLIILAVFSLLYYLEVPWLGVLLKAVDISSFTAIVLAFVLDGISKQLSKAFKSKTEDITKLTKDYDGLVKRYCRVDDFMTTCNATASEKNLRIGRKRKTCKCISDSTPDVYRLPVCSKISLKDSPVTILDDPQKMYIPNSYVTEHLGKVSDIHEFSNKYNATTIRMDCVTQGPAGTVFRTSRTKYYYLLMTNRSIDYQINGLSYRELFEEGPFLRDLEHSTLSNHIGYNGYIETADGQFIFIKRNHHVSVGKDTLQTSVSASLKAKYALDQEQMLTKEGIMHAIVQETIDELHLSNLSGFESKKAALFDAFTFENSVLYFYRDLVEGGKPQLMFYMKLDLLSSEIKQAFTNAPKKRTKENLSKTDSDGHNILLVSREDMSEIYATPDCFVIKGVAYQATPSAVATYLMMMEHLNDASN